MIPAAQNSLLLSPAEPAQRWKTYLRFLSACGLGVVATVIYIFNSVTPSFFAILPLCIFVYLLGSSLRGWPHMRIFVASVDEEYFFSVNWRGSVSVIFFPEIREIALRGRGLVFTDRFFKNWSGYLSGATEAERRKFLGDLVEFLKERYPKITIAV